MKDLTKMVDEKKTVAAKSNSSWKDRILEYLLEQPDKTATVIDVLKATDDKFVEGQNLTKREHCLASQRTYMKDMFADDKKVPYFGIAAESTDGIMKLVGVYKDANTIHPFK